MGICGTQAAKQHAEGNTADLSAKEANVYEQVFKSEGFSVGEFRRLLRLGGNGARWEHLAAGENVEAVAADGALRMVVQGSCMTSSSSRRPDQVTRSAVGVGGFFPEDVLLGGRCRSF